MWEDHHRDELGLRRLPDRTGGGFDISVRSSQGGQAGGRGAHTRPDRLIPAQPARPRLRTENAGGHERTSLRVARAPRPAQFLGKLVRAMPSRAPSR